MVPAGGWQKTTLWAELDDREDEAAGSLKQAVSGILPDVEKILDSGGGCPPEFTLHDAGHSWRVAQWMAKLAGPELLAELGPHDLAMLLLSAYLHDIGMTPPLARVDAHLSFLQSGDDGSIDPEDAEHLQAWLDDEWDGRVPPIAEGTPTPESLKLIRQILGGYVRHRHNDWSEAWIRDRLADERQHPYPAWPDDLVRLCKSHHFGIEQLRATEFNPRLVGSPATVLHLRYCACLLRIADLLDFDPERTPPILFEHRDIEGESAIFWHKDHDLFFVYEDGHISLEAQPADALTHHAIEETVQDLDRELLICRRLADETHFDRRGDSSLPHKWTLDTNARAVITPRDNAYEYVDGTFRPDPKKLLSLVAGVDLYGSVFAAVREMLQNAFDAVREQIAHERLLLADPSDTEEGERLALGHSVELVLEQKGDQVLLTCRDTGTGMSREIIANRFLVGGTKPRHDSRQLERACQAHGFSVGRTARFGIGVLSYFLLAGHLNVRTRRSIEAEDPDGTGWVFSTFGLTDFGELKGQPRHTSGTEIELRIRPEAMDRGLDKFASDLAKYVDTTLKRVPCRFSFRAPGLDVEEMESGPGWIDRTGEVRNAFLGRISKSMPGTRASSLEILPAHKRELLEEEAARWDEVRKRAEQALRIDVQEGDLPDGLGRFRVFIGYFQLSVGKSLAFLDLEKSGEAIVVRPFGSVDALLTSSQSSMSWNGMNVYEEMDSGEEWDEYYPSVSDLPRNVIIELDWTSDAAGRLAVHRNSLETSEAAHKAGEHVIGLARTILRDLVEGSQGSPVGLLNARVADIMLDEEALNPWWVHEQGDPRERVLSPIEFPVIYTDDEREENPVWRGAPTTRVALLKALNRSYNPDSLSWHGTTLQPQRVGLDTGERRPISVWERLQLRNRDERRTCTTEFPPQWRQLVGAELRDSSFKLLNATHPLVEAASREARQWVSEQLKRDPLPHQDSMSADKLAAWMLLCLERGFDDLWNGLHERSESFLPEAWAKIDGLAEHDALMYWVENFRSGLHVLTVDKWETYDLEDPQAAEFLQALEADPDWALTSDGEEGAAEGHSDAAP